MTIDRFKRVLWRLKEMPDANGCYTNKVVRLAIMEEIGTDDRTINDAIRKMRELKMLSPAGMGMLRVHTEEG